MFVENIEIIMYNVVVTVGEKYLIPKRIGTFSYSFNDDKGQLYTKKLNSVLYFTDSTVNILSETVLDESKKDDEGTWLLTKRKYSIFIRDFGKYKRQLLTQKIFFQN